MRRSLRSWALQQFKWIKGGKRSFEERSEEGYAALLESYAESAAKDFANPERWTGMPVRESRIDGMQVFSWNDSGDPRQRVLIYLHGGAYVSPPNKHHFKTLRRLSTALDARVVFPLYPRAPRFSYKESFARLDQLWRQMLEGVESAAQLSLLGDSAGGGLALGFAMYLRDHQLPQPKDIILLSPWLDLRTNHPDIPKYVDADPVLSVRGLRRLGLAWAGSPEAMSDPYVSPVLGDVSGLGRIGIWVGSYEIFLPDCALLHQILCEKGIEHHYEVAEKMSHVYALYPLPEARRAQQRIVEWIAQKPKNNNE